MTDLRQRVYTAISKPACDRCQARMDWGPSDCDKHCCHVLYDKETDAVMEIIADIAKDKEWMNKASEDCNIKYKLQGFNTCYTAFILMLKNASTQMPYSKALRDHLSALAYGLEAERKETLKKYIRSLENSTGD